MDRLLDEQGLADYLGVSHEWVRSKVKARQIPFRRLPGGRLVRFHADDIAEIVAAGHSPALNGALATR
jgi:excisionase family DNA binding protein